MVDDRNARRMASCETSGSYGWNGHQHGLASPNTEPLLERDASTKAVRSPAPLTPGNLAGYLIPAVGSQSADPGAIYRGATPAMRGTTLPGRHMPGRYPVRTSETCKKGMKP